MTARPKNTGTWGVVHTIILFTNIDNLWFQIPIQTVLPYLFYDKPLKHSDSVSYSISIVFCHVRPYFLFFLHVLLPVLDAKNIIFVMVPVHFHDVTTIKFGEKSRKTLKTLFHVFRAEKLVFKL